MKCSYKITQQNVMKLLDACAYMHTNLMPHPKCILMYSIGDSGPESTVAIGEVIFQNSETNNPLGKVLNKMEDNLPFIYTVVAFLGN